VSSSLFIPSRPISLVILYIFIVEKIFSFDWGPLRFGKPHLHAPMRLCIHMLLTAHRAQSALGIVKIKNNFQRNSGLLIIGQNSAENYLFINVPAIAIRPENAEYAIAV